MGMVVEQHLEFLNPGNDRTDLQAKQLVKCGDVTGRWFDNPSISGENIAGAFVVNPVLRRVILLRM